MAGQPVWPRVVIRPGRPAYPDERRPNHSSGGEPITHPAGWATLGTTAKAYRVFHSAWSVAGLASLGWIWACALQRRRDRGLWASIAFLSIEGAGLVAGGGDCPLGPFQASLGDEVPFFELVLPPRAAKAAVPVLAGASVAGFIAVALRPPRTAAGSTRAARQAIR
jgi:hypothetical protein